MGRLRLLQLARFVSYVETPAGFALTREGHQSTRFCLLLHGSVVVSKRAPEAEREGRGDRPEITLAVISAEDETPYFGENCILSAQIDSAAGATVSTCERSHLLVVYLESAADFLRALPEFGSSLLERKAMLRRTNKRLVAASSIALR